MFSKLSDDVVLFIFFKLEDDPRNWARLACVCTKFSSFIRNVCYKSKCLYSIPSIAADLSSSSDSPPGGWAALHKISVCCPGLHHAGVLFDNSDFGLLRELGPHESYPISRSSEPAPPATVPVTEPTPACCWSLYDDLYYDTVYDNTESDPNDQSSSSSPLEVPSERGNDKNPVVVGGGEFSINKRRKICRPLRSHLAPGIWNLSREQGNKLLASRFRGDCLYICDWPGCVHVEEKRNYMLFRGIFKNFKRSGVWRTINDGNRSKVDLNCGFCGCKETWDLHSAFCLRRVFGYHDDGEPVVRAYVCENGHVSGAWTDWPLYA